MSNTDKLKNKAQEAKGEVQEGVGKATNDHEMEAKGKANKTKANLKQAGEKAKDALK